MAKASENRRHPYSGLLLLNKPVGMTSHDAVKDIRRILNQRRVGHTGTLDPLAEGLMVLCLGSATKASPYLSSLSKVYHAEIYLGKSSTTFDKEGVDETAPSKPVPNLTDEDWERLFRKYTGKITQKVPLYSAVRVKGKHLYDFARQGKEVEPPEREVEIYELKLLDFQPPFLRIRVHCSGGTYIRSLAHELGEHLGCGAYLSKLQRTAVGKMKLTETLTVEEIETLHREGTLGEKLIPIDDVLPYSAVMVDKEFEKAVIHGRELLPRHVVRIQGAFGAGDYILLKDLTGKVLAVGLAEIASHELKKSETKKIFSYKRVLN